MGGLPEERGVWVAYLRREGVWVAYLRRGGVGGLPKERGCGWPT